MYCAHCGKELADGANFCTACGSQATVAERLAIAEEAAAEEMGGVSAALSSGRARSRLRMSPMILLVLALALTAGIAAAAIYVYNEVYLPSIREEAPLESSDTEASDANAGVSNSEAVSYSFEYATDFGDGRNRFFYPDIKASEPNEAIEALNERMRAEIQEAANDSFTNEELDNYDPGRANAGGESLFVSRQYFVTYFADDVISIWKVSRRMTSGAARETVTSACETIDLRTGEAIAPETVLGVSEDNLFNAAYTTVSGLTSDFANKRIAGYYDADQEIRDAVTDSRSHFFLVPGGIAIAFVTPYEFGTYLPMNSAVVYIAEGQSSPFEAGEVLSVLNPSGLGKLPQAIEIK